MLTVIGTGALTGHTQKSGRPGWHETTQQVLKALGRPDSEAVVKNEQGLVYFTTQRLVVPFWDYLIGSYVNTTKRNYFGAYG